MGLFTEFEKKEKKIKEKAEERALKLEYETSKSQIPSQLTKEEKSYERLKRKEDYETKKDELSLSRLKKERRDKIVSKLASFGEKTFSKPMLKTPHAKVPSYSATKVIQQASRGNIQLVRQGEIPEAREFNRSPFFSEEFRKDDKETKSWLFKD
jgi:hypothetical protein